MDAYRRPRGRSAALLGLVALFVPAGCDFLSGMTSTAPSTQSAPAAGTDGSMGSDADAPAVASTPDAPASSSPPPARPVSITMRNRCNQTVKLFFGDEPKFGSGTYSSLGSNTSTSHSFMPGDMVWIVDDSQEGISSATASEGIREIEILEGCTGMRTR